MPTATIDPPVVDVPLCEVVSVMRAAYLRIHGHWGRDRRCHHGCACPIPPEAIATRLTDDQAERLVILLVRFAYAIHTPDEQTEMLALITQGAAA